MIINNKIKQYFGGNWGKPNDVEQACTPKVEEFDRMRTGKKKKKKAKREPYIYPGDLCPFCKTELPIDEEMLKAQSTRWMSGIFTPRIKKCPSCKALEVPECPACKRKVWFNPITFIFKHQTWSGCGFEGQLIFHEQKDKKNA